MHEFAILVDEWEVHEFFSFSRNQIFCWYKNVLSFFMDSPIENIVVSHLG